MKTIIALKNRLELRRNDKIKAQNSNLSSACKNGYSIVKNQVFFGGVK